MANVEWKHLSIRRWGWKRVVKNTERFGWELMDATERTTTTTKTSYEGRVVGDDKVEITPRTQTTTKKRVELSFARDRSYIQNVAPILMLEIFYWILFTIRRIFWLLMAIAFFVTLAIMLISSGDETLIEPFTKLFGIVLIIWLLARIAEGVISRIAGKIIRFSGQP